MPNKMKENRTITQTAAVIITALMTAAFSAVWLLYYNNNVFRTYRIPGAFFAILIWLVLYMKFGQVYRAFKITSNAIGETAFSQFLSIGFADLILYVAGCLVARKYVNILPGAAIVILQSVLGFVWATRSKQYFLAHVEPRRCLMVYDANIEGQEPIKGQQFIRKLEKTYGHLFEIVEHIPVSDELNETLAEIAEYPVIFIYDMPLDKRSKIVNYCVDTGKRFYVTPTVEDIVARGYNVKHFIDTPLMEYNGSFKEVQTYFGKRACDIVLSLLMLVLTSPIMLIAAIAIKLEDGGTVFFRQKRVGQGGRVFDILKFRSMVMDAEKDGKPRPCVAGDSRITKVGNILRSTRLDELPQLFNILGGSLSLVGPRPERCEHVKIFTNEIPEFSYRLRVPAGLTGYAQIYGKYNTSARDKLLLDLLYIEQQSFLMDMRIVFLTVKIMFMPESTEGFEEEKSESIGEKSKGLDEAENEKVSTG